MNTEAAEVRYTRRGGQGTLKLHGVIDIFEATALHTAAQSALNDAKARDLRVDLAQTERLDLSAVQLLLALRRETTATGRTFQAENVPENLAQMLTLLGMTL